MTTCQKAAEVPQQTQIEATVEMKSYRYYKVNTDEMNSNELTIQLDMVKGRSEVFYSFSEQYPKSPDHLLDPSATRGELFVESRAKKIKKAYYNIDVPSEQPNDTLYFSVRGIDDQNKFRFYVHNKTVNFSINLRYSPILLTFGALFSSFFF